MTESGPSGAGTAAAAEPVSVCIAARDEERCLPDTVRSIAGQGYPAIREIIICVNASTDGTMEVARLLGRSDPRIRVMTSSPGKPSAWNAMVGAAKSDLLAFVDADVYVMPEAIGRAVDELSSAHGIVGVSAYLGRSRGRGASGPLPVFSIETHGIMAGCFHVIRRSRVLEIIRERTGAASMPPNIINEDEWLTRMLIDLQTGRKLYAVIRTPLLVYHAERSLADRLRFLSRTRLGTLQLDAYLGRPTRPSLSQLLEGRRRYRKSLQACGVGPVEERLRRARMLLLLAGRVLVYAVLDAWIRLSHRDLRLSLANPARYWPVTRSTKRRHRTRGTQAVRRRP